MKKIQTSISFSLNVLYKLQWRFILLFKKNRDVASSCIPRTLRNIAIQMRNHNDRKKCMFTYANYLTMLHIMSDRVHIKYTK